MIGTTFKGGLGNNMFQYAYIRSVAERKGLDFFIKIQTHREDSFDKIFPHLHINRRLVNNVVVHNYKELIGFDLDNFFYDPPDDYLLTGYFQNHNYFKESDVREWFKIYLNKEEKDKYNELVSIYDPDEYGYIYFRGTDFNDIKIYKTSTEYFENAKCLIDRKKFIVITDDIKEAQKVIIAEDYLSNNYKIDLKLLTSAKKLIIPKATTFGWWGAYLSNADIIAPDWNNECCIKNDRFKYIK